MLTLLLTYDITADLIYIYTFMSTYIKYYPAFVFKPKTIKIMLKHEGFVKKKKISIVHHALKILIRDRCMFIVSQRWDSQVFHVDSAEIRLYPGFSTGFQFPLAVCIFLCMYKSWTRIFTVFCSFLAIIFPSLGLQYWKEPIWQINNYKLLFQIWRQFGKKLAVQYWHSVQDSL